VNILSSYKTIAKSNGTSLKKHTEDALIISNYLISSNKEILQNWGELNGIEIRPLLKEIHTAIFFHDFGKGAVKWQKEAYKEEPHLPPHASYSGYFLLQNETDFCSHLACISHHSLLTESSLIMFLTLKISTKNISPNLQLKTITKSHSIFHGKIILEA